MPDFICLLLANNEVIVCSGYVATQMLGVVIKQVLTYMYYQSMTLIYQLGVVTFFLSRATFVMQLYQTY